MGACGSKEPPQAVSEKPITRPVAEPKPVHIHVPRSTKPEEETVIEVTKPMRTKRHVTENTVSLDVSTMPNEELKEFVEMFPSQTTLQQLYIRKSDSNNTSLFRLNLPFICQLLKHIASSRLLLLELSSLPASDELSGALEIALTNNTQLETLSLHLSRPPNLKTDIAIILCKALSSNISLQSLDLSNTDLGGARAVELLNQVLKTNTTIKTVKLSSAGLGDCAGDLSEALRVNHTLLSIDLSLNIIGDMGGRKLARALTENNSIQKLILNDVQLNNKVAPFFKLLKENLTLKDLSLRGNRFGADGAASLAKFIKANFSLRSLDVSMCQLGPLGAKWLAKQLKSNVSLTSLKLSSNNMGFSGVKEILNALVTSKINVLDISDNNVGEKGDQLVLRLLKKNNCLTEVFVSNNDFTSNAESKIEDLVTYNQGLRDGFKIIPRLLQFNPFKFDEHTHTQAMRAFTISNMKKFHLAFAVLTNNPETTAITPNQGFLDPGTNVQIQVLLMGKFATDLPCPHVFQVRIASLTAEAHAQLTPKEFWQMQKNPANYRTNTIRGAWAVPKNINGTHNANSITAKKTSDLLALVAKLPSSGNLYNEQVTALKQQLKRGGENGSINNSNNNNSNLSTEQALDEQLSKLMDILSQSGGKEGTGGGSGSSSSHSAEEDEEVSALKKDLQAIQTKLKAIQADRAKSPSKLSSSTSLGADGEKGAEGDKSNTNNDEEEEVKSEEEEISKNGTSNNNNNGLDDTLKEFGSPGLSGGEDNFDIANPSSPNRVAAVDFALAKTMWDDNDDDEDENNINKKNGNGSSNNNEEGDLFGGEFGLDFDLADFDPSKRNNNGVTTHSSDNNVEDEGGVPLAPPMSPPSAPPLSMFDQKETPATHNNNLKKFHWTTLAETEAASGVFAELDSERVKLDTDEIVRLFSHKQASSGSNNKNLTQQQKALIERNKQQQQALKLQLVDTKKSYNLNIALARCKISIETIKCALIEMNHTLLPEEFLESLLKYAPTKEELRNCCSYTGNLSLLGPTELFFREVGEISRLKMRLQLLLFKTTFDEDTEIVFDSLKVVDQARTQIFQSSRLKKILEVVLALGNFMNSGQAKGFQLSALSQMKSSKAADNKTTLLTYLIQHIQKNCKDAEDFVRDCPSVKPASSIEASFVTSSLRTLLAHLQALEQELKRAMQTSDPNDKFVVSMLEFYKRARARAKKLTLARNRIVQETAELMLSYGVSSSDAQHGWETFFKTWSSFFDDFTQGVNALQAQAEEVKQQEARRKRAESMKSPTANRSSSSSFGGGGGNGNNNSGSCSSSLENGSSSDVGSAASAVMSNLMANRRISVPSRAEQFSEPKAQAVD